MRTTLIFSCVLLISCASTLNGDRYEPGFDDVCDVTERFETHLLSDDYDVAGDEYADAIMDLFAMDRIQTDVIEAIWDSSEMEMSDPVAAYKVWTDAAIIRGNDEWECDVLLRLFRFQNQRYLANLD